MEANENCDHVKTTRVYVRSMDDETGDMVGNWEYEESSAVVDVDLHRFRCTRCGQIGYYSSAAKAFHEDGKRAPGVEGLE